MLSLPSAMSWLGWVGGIISLLLFYAISLWCSLMLTAVYKVNGRRHSTYSEAVLYILGRRSSRVLVVVQRVMLCLAAIGYHIAAADSMTYIANRGCAAGQQCVVKQWQMTLVFGGETPACHQHNTACPACTLVGHDCACCVSHVWVHCAVAQRSQTTVIHCKRCNTPVLRADALDCTVCSVCQPTLNQYVLYATVLAVLHHPLAACLAAAAYPAGLQVLLSLLPNLESVWLVSALGAVMSLAYSLLTVGLGASQAHHGLGSMWGRSAPPAERVFSIFNALGQMAFGKRFLQLYVGYVWCAHNPSAAEWLRSSWGVMLRACKDQEPFCMQIKLAVHTGCIRSRRICIAVCVCFVCCLQRMGVQWCSLRSKIHSRSRQVGNNSKAAGWEGVISRQTHKHAVLSGLQIENPCFAMQVTVHVLSQVLMICVLMLLLNSLLLQMRRCPCAKV